MTAMMGLILGAVAFVGTHFAMSHPLRAPMVNALGEKMFGLVYVVVSFATLYLMVRHYHGAFADSP
ncbi:MAG: NnrU family protein, partial [Sphingomicrobium sp.]